MCNEVNSYVSVRYTSGGSRIFQGVPTPKGEGGVPTYYSAKFSSQLHENDENWAEREGVVRPKFVYVDPPLFSDKCYLPCLFVGVRFAF